MVTYENMKKKTISFFLKQCLKFKKFINIQKTYEVYLKIFVQPLYGL